MKKILIAAVALSMLSATPPVSTAAHAWGISAPEQPDAPNVPKFDYSKKINFNIPKIGFKNIPEGMKSASVHCFVRGKNPETQSQVVVFDGEQKLPVDFTKAEARAETTLGPVSVLAGVHVYGFPTTWRCELKLKKKNGDILIPGENISGSGNFYKKGTYTSDVKDGSIAVSSLSFTGAAKQATAEETVGKSNPKVDAAASADLKNKSMAAKKLKDLSGTKPNGGVSATGLSAPTGANAQRPSTIQPKKASFNSPYQAGPAAPAPASSRADTPARATEEEGTTSSTRGSR